jgi:hypothetical protein
MIFVYRQKGSDSAHELALLRAENFIRLRNHPQRGPDPARPMDHIRWDRVQRQPDRFSVVCWGEGGLLLPTGVRVLNNAPLLSKFKQALLLKEKGVATVEVTQTLPLLTNATLTPADPLDAAFETAQQLADEFVQLTRPSRTDPFRDGVKQLNQVLLALFHAIDVPAPEAAQLVDQTEWLGRSNSHIAGQDLLQPPQRPDYYAKRETLVAEYRVHSFRGVSIRGGKKIPVEGVTPHAWVRSSLGGWKISYDGRSVKQRHRDLAHAAVKALGLDFGAVDLGEKADGSLIVLEVNRAPGLDGGTITQYAKHLKRWDAGLPAVEETENNL